MDGYQFLRRDRLGKQGEGVVVYVREQQETWTFDWGQMMSQQRAC